MVGARGGLRVVVDMMDAYEDRTGEERERTGGYEVAVMREVLAERDEKR